MAIRFKLCVFIGHLYMIYPKLSRAFFAAFIIELMDVKSLTKQIFSFVAAPPGQQEAMDARRISSALPNGRHQHAHSSSTSATGAVTSGVGSMQGPWSISSAGSLPVLCKPDGGESGIGGVVTSMRNEIETLRKELARSRDVIFKLQERDKHLRER